jgi:fructuronate reductase
MAHAAARLPAYDRAKVTPGIVHLGLGNFHRAHQAVYTDDSLAADPGWGIRGVSLRSAAMARALVPQDGLYTLGLRDAGGLQARVIGSVLTAISAADGVGPVLAALTDPATRIVTLTVTEKGYCRDGAGDLDADHPDIRADLLAPDAPRSAPGLLAVALRMRRDAGIPPFTVLSCDNLPANGVAAAWVVTQMAELMAPRFAAWIGTHVAFPSSMVDRIVPATTDADRAAMQAATGLTDAWPVMTEPFTQWVIEDSFPTGRPSWPAAQLVGDVTPFETMKLRMLNGAHTTLACFAQLLGVQAVAGAMDHPGLARLIARVMDQAAGTLDVPGADLPGYAAALQARFRNPALHHATAQIATDTSQKLPQRLLAPIRAAHDRGLPWDALALGVAAWIVLPRDLPVTDPLSGTLARIARAHPDPADHAAAVLDLPMVFGDLREATWFREPLIAKAQRIATHGADAVIQGIAGNT